MWAGMVLRLRRVFLSSRNASGQEAFRFEGEVAMLIQIQYGAVKNTAPNGGFMPAIWVNGRQSGDTYGRGYSECQAIEVAMAQAQAESERYHGDYQTEIVPRGK